TDGWRGGIPCNRRNRRLPAPASGPYGSGQTGRGRLASKDGGGMYPDNSLTPTEAIRLAALGSLAQAPKPYAALATEIRNFTGRIAGPSLDLIGPPLELLKVEGLVEPTTSGEDAPMRVTEAGLAEL